MNVNKAMRVFSPRAWEHWGRELGVVQRVKIQALQFAKYPLAACGRQGGVNRIELHLTRLQREIPLKKEQFIAAKQQADFYLQQGFSGCDPEIRDVIIALNGLPFFATTESCAGHLYFRYQDNDPQKPATYYFLKPGSIEFSIDPDDNNSFCFLQRIEELAGEIGYVRVRVGKYDPLHGGNGHIIVEFPGMKKRALYVRDSKRMVVDDIKPLRAHFSPSKHMFHVLDTTSTAAERRRGYCPEDYYDLSVPYGYTIRSREKVDGLSAQMREFWTRLASEARSFRTEYGEIFLTGSR